MVFLNAEMKPVSKRTKGAWSKPKRQRAQAAPGPVTILTDAGITEIQVRQSGKPTAQGLRNLNALYGA